LSVGCALRTLNRMGAEEGRAGLVAQATGLWAGELATTNRLGFA
jgi:hypothetical protein